MNQLGLVLMIVLAFAGCASGFNPAEAARRFVDPWRGASPVMVIGVELYSRGEPTPPHVEVPSVIGVGGPSVCNPCGSGVSTSGTVSVGGYKIR